MACFQEKGGEEMKQPGFFDLSDRYEQISRMKDPLEKLNEVIDWKVFLPLLNRALEKQRKSAAGRKPYNRLLMFKILILQSLYNLSDHQVEYQIRDRLSFMRFLGLQFEDCVPDEKTLWSFREVLVESNMLEKIFNRFNRYLNEKGFGAESGTLIDASIVEVPKQRNSRDDNHKIKDGKIPESFQKNSNRLRQKDVDARWVKKLGENYYGYKNHVNVDAKHKLIRAYEVSAASKGDIHHLKSLLKKAPQKDKRVWADSAYYSQEMERDLSRLGYESRVIHRYRSHQPEWSRKDRENKRRAKIRKRVEHVFGLMENSLGGKFIRTIGLLRAKAKIGLMNLVHNCCRYEQLCRLGST
jgi:IS5 family transposase